MKRLLPFLLLIPAAWIASAQDGPPPVKIETTQQKASYAVGYLTAQHWKRQGAKFDLDAVFAGIRAAADESEPAMPEAEMRAAMEAFEAELRAELAKRSAALAQKNAAEGKAFLAKNGGKPGITTTASGLQYEVLREGTGPKPTAKSRVQVHYRGSLLDGTEFDSSYGRGEPESFPVSGVIQGWTEALQLMRVGAKVRLFVPAELAYGEDPRPGGPIGPNATLIFEVELVAIQAE